jgi:3-deoxy-D-manno-octulosonic-acid transferase
MILFDLLYILFLLLTVPLWGVKIFFKKEYREILKHRLSPDISPPAGDKKRLWIHAVSVGEVRSLKSLVKQLKETSFNGHMELVLSVTTPSGYRCAREEFPDIKVINAPLDFSFAVKRFIRNINPGLLILNELEIWPNWVTLMHRKNIRMLLINGRMSRQAFKRYRYFKFLLKPFFTKIHLSLVQGDIYRRRFMQLGIAGDKIKVCGNIKTDEAFIGKDNLPPQDEIKNLLGIDSAGKIIVTAASSHADDERVLAPVIAQMADTCYFIIVPRHLERVGSIEKLLQDHGVAYTTWSKSTTGNKTNRTLIFDKMGYLFHVLKITDIVVMGGTFDPAIGGHNLYEPAALGKCILGGPHYNNFPDIGAELVEEGIYHVVTDSQQCIDLLSRFSSGGIDWKTIGERAKDVVSRSRGSLGCTLKEIQRLAG